MLLMLMVLPLLSPTEIDYSQEYGLRELFWMGRSNCVPQQETNLVHPVHDMDIIIDHELIQRIETDTDVEKTDFYCDSTRDPYVTTEGWLALLRMYASAASVQGQKPTWTLLWLYVPDYTRNGRMGEI